MQGYRIELERDTRYGTTRVTVYVGDDPLWLFRIYPRRRVERPAVASVYEQELRGGWRGRTKRLIDLDARGLSLPAWHNTPGENFGWLLDLAMEAGLEFPALVPGRRGE